MAASPGPEPSRLRRAAGSIALAAASVAVTALLLEAAFRLTGVSVGTVQINRARCGGATTRACAFELRPGAVVRAEVDYAISSAGLRNPEVPVAKPAGVRRIAVLGDSIAFGYWVAEEQVFARQLERMLGGRRSRS